MPRKTNQKLKLLYLMKILNEHTDEEHTLTINQMIQMLEEYSVTAERKSIYSDLELLRVFGLDIVTRKEKSFGYYIASREFELPELKLLVDAVQSSKFITAKKSEQLIKKLATLASRYEAQQLQRQVYVANRNKTVNESIYYNVDKIHSAISNDARISFRYFDWTPAKEKRFKRDGGTYIVSPWALSWDDENYYLIAYDSDSGIIKHFRVDKMVDIIMLDEPRDGKSVFKSFDMAVYSKQVFSMFGGEYEYVTLLCKNEYAGIIIDRFGKDVSMSPADGNCFKTVVKVAISPQFLSWVFGLSDGIRIVSPQAVVDRFKDMAEEAINQHD